MPYIPNPAPNLLLVSVSYIPSVSNFIAVYPRAKGSNVGRAFP